MDDSRFDRITRQMGEGRSRRSVVKSLGAAALAAVGVAGMRREADARPPKVGVCHITGNRNKPWTYIMVSESAAAVLESRGDTVNPDFSSDLDHCGVCGNSCEWAPYDGYPVCDEGECGFACYNGYHDNGAGECVPDAVECPEGTHDDGTGECVPDAVECPEGYHDDGTGTCVWNDTACEVYSFSGAICFWMENVSGHYCWVQAFGENLAQCQAADSCYAGGGGGSNGGCYKWSTSSDTVIWPNVDGWPS